VRADEPPPRPGRLRVVQLANFISPTSGGLGTVVRALARGYRQDGLDPVLVLPGDRRQSRDPQPTQDRRQAGDPQQLERHAEERPSVEILGGPRLPGSGGAYRVLLGRRPVAATLRRLAPDLVEVHDQTTLAWVSGWCREAGIPAVLFAHERIDLVAAEATRWLDAVPRGAIWRDRATDGWTSRLADRFDAVVCASRFAAEPFLTGGGAWLSGNAEPSGHARPSAQTAPSVHVVPFGVDLDLFRPRTCRDLPWDLGTLRLVSVGRLHPDKRPELALDTLAELCAAGVRAQLVHLGEGPLGPALRAKADRERLPARYLGHQPDPVRVAEVLSAADVALAPCPRETFALAALEAMACGTPVVVSARGAAGELLEPGAGATASSARQAASAVRALAADAGAGAAARAAAEHRSWTATVAAVREVHDQVLVRPRDPACAARRSGRAGWSRRPSPR